MPQLDVLADKLVLLTTNQTTTNNLTGIFCRGSRTMSRQLESARPPSNSHRMCTNVGAEHDGLEAIGLTCSHQLTCVPKANAGATALICKLIKSMLLVSTLQALHVVKLVGVPSFLWRSLACKLMLEHENDTAVFLLVKTRNPALWAPDCSSRATST